MSIRQITNRSRNIKRPQPKTKQITLKEAKRLIAELGQVKDTKNAETHGKFIPKQGVFDLGNNRSLVTNLSLLDATGDYALVIENPDPQEVAAATREAGLWRETVGAFQLGIPVSTKDDMLLHHLRLLSVMTWRAAKLNRKSRWYKTFTHYVELLAEKVRALGGDPFAVPATPDGMIPQLPSKDGNQTGGAAETDHGGVGDPEDPYFEPQTEDWLAGTSGLEASVNAKPSIRSGKISGLVFDHFGNFEGFTLETYDGSHHRYFSREPAILDLARTAWTERYVVTVITVTAQSRRVRRLVIRGYV